MEADMRIEKLGDGLIVRIPDDVADALKLKDGDNVDLVPAYSSYMDDFPKMTREEAIEGLRNMRIDLPADYKFDRDEANAR